MTPAGDGAISVDEAIGGYESQDAGKRFLKESPEHFLRLSVRLKRCAYEESNAAFDVERVLDLVAAVQAIGVLYTTFDDLALASVQFGRDVLTVENENPFLTLSDSFPSLPQTSLAALSVGLLFLAKKTWEATEQEKEFAYEEFVTARAIEDVAIEDNGIDAAELLSRFIMDFDIRPDTSVENWKNKIEYYRPSVNILPIKPAYIEAIETAKERIRAEDIEQGIYGTTLKTPVKLAKKVGHNLTKGTAQAAQSLNPSIITASKKVLAGTAATTLLSWPENGVLAHIKRVKRCLQDDFNAAGKALGKSNFVQTIETTAQGLETSLKLWKHRKYFRKIKAGKTWEEQTMDRREFSVCVAYTTHLDDQDNGKKRADEITVPALSDSYTPSYFDERKVQGERIRDIRRNVRQQFETAKGFVYANSFMAINGVFGSLALYNAGQDTNATAAATIGLFANSALSYTNAFMNIPPMLSIGHGLIRQSTRYQENAEDVLHSQSNVRRQLKDIRSLLEQPQPAANDQEEQVTPPQPVPGE